MEGDLGVCATDGVSPLKVLFIGNSYTYCNDLPGLVKSLAESAGGLSVDVELVAKGGFSFEAHWREHAIPEVVARARFDAAVLQEHSLGAVENRPRMYEYARRIHAEAKRNGARTILYMTWGRKYGPSMIKDIAEAYSDLARELGAWVAPAGLAWDLAVREGHDLHTEDGSHPNIKGSYLAACCVCGVLPGGRFGEAAPDAVAGVSKEDARALQRIARETLSAYEQPAAGG